MAVRIGDLPDSDVIARKLPSYEVVLCASPSYLSRRPSSVGDDGADEHDWVEYRFPRRAPSDVASWRRKEEDGLRRRVVLQCNDSRAVCAAVLAGVGVAWLPSILVRDRLAAGDLIPLSPEGCYATRPMHLIYPQRTLAPSGRAFVDWFLRAADGR